MEGGPSTVTRPTDGEKDGDEDKDEDEDEDEDESTLQPTSNDIEATSGAAGTSTERPQSQRAIANVETANLPNHTGRNILTKDHVLPDLIWNLPSSQDCSRE